MKRLMTPVGLLAIAVLGLWACKPSPPGNTDAGVGDVCDAPPADLSACLSDVPACRQSSRDDGGALTPDSICPRVASSYCERLSQCGQLSADQLDCCFAATYATCERRFGTSLRSGALSFRETEARVFVNQVHAWNCTGLRHLSDELRLGTTYVPPFVGPAREQGRACVDRCETGWCGVVSDNTCSTCNPTLADGEACTLRSSLPLPGQCAASSACTQGPDGGATCQPLRADGEPCGPCRTVCGRRGADGGLSICGITPLGEQCLTHTLCGPSAYCKDLYADRYIQIPGTCTQRTPLGASCTPPSRESPFNRDDGCEGGGVCLEGVCQNHPPFTRNVGESCKQPLSCVDTAYCEEPSDGGTPRCVPSRAEGASCKAFASNDQCDDGLSCTPIEPCVNGVCRAVCSRQLPLPMSECPCGACATP